LILLPKGDKELLKDVRTNYKKNGDLDLPDLIKKLKETGFPLDKNMISYYSPVQDMSVYCGNDPLPTSIVIPAKEI